MKTCAWLKKWFPIDPEDPRSRARQVLDHVTSVIWVLPMLAAINGKLGRL